MSDFNPTTNSTTNRQQRRNGGRKYPDAMSATKWVNMISKISNDEEMKQFNSLVDSHHPNNIPMTAIKQAFEGFKNSKMIK